MIAAKKSLTQAALKGGAATFVLALMVSPVAGYAQAAAPAAAPAKVAAADAAADEGTIIVTGSLIRNPNLQRSSPVNVTTADTIELLQQNNAEAILREIPGIVPSIGSAVNNGNGGASFVNLRGLGSNRNVVLLDGQRITPAELNGRFDLNNVPLALVNRVDVLTGGSSTTYGADAIAGVVNFVTKKDFAGVEATVGEALNEKGDGNAFKSDLTIGANFDDGKGNAVLSIGYQKTDAVYQGARDISNLNTDSYSGTVGGGSGTATPSRFSVPGLGTRQINAAGALVPTFSRFNFNPYNIFLTPFTRYNIYGAARYEINDNIEVYSRALFSKNVVQTIIAPSGSFGAPASINVNNPFLPAAARATFCANSDFDPNTAGIQSLTTAQCAAAAAATGPNDPNYRKFTTTVFRRATEVGPRISDFQTQIFDYQAGLRGKLNEHINWDLSGSYGESQNIQTLKNYTSNNRVRQSLLTNDGVTCQDPTGGCVPVNFFGPPGSISAAGAKFLAVDSTSTTRTSLGQVHATLSGDLGFTVPSAAEPVGFALGAEYRTYHASQQSDLLAQSGDLGGSGGAAPNIDGGYSVYEGYGELIAPLVSDKPGFQSLTLEAGGRYSHYKVQAPTKPSYDTYTYKVGGSWVPVDGLKIRGNYAHAVRAPNIAELFSPVNTTLTNLGTDPCSGAAPLNNPTLKAVCLAQGAPAFTIGTISNPTAGQANSTGGGNINLKPEKSNSYTIGAVLTPSQIPSFSLTVDYYNIKVTDAITTPTPADAIASCFGSSPTNPPASAATNPACLIIRRNPASGGLDGDATTTPGLFLGLSNLGTLKTDGIDVSANYAHDVGFAKLNLNFTGNWTNHSKFQATPTSLDRECTGFYSVNCGSIQPKFEFSQRSTLAFSNFDVSLLWRYIHPVNFEKQQQADDLAAAIAGGCTDPTGTDPDGCVTEPAFRHIKAYHYFDLTGRFFIMENLTLTVSVQNMFDRAPPLVGATIGSTSFNSGNTYPSTYDALGRRYSASIRFRFQ